MTNLEIAEWAANQYISHKDVSPTKDEETIVKYILTTRYKWVNISPEFDKIATSNLPYVKTFFDLLTTLLNIELEEGRTSKLTYLIFYATLHLRTNKYFEKINSPDLELLNECLKHILKFVTSKVKNKEDYEKHFFVNFSSLIVHQRGYREFRTYEEVESVLNMFY
jgi:hypothetical protein